MTKNKANQLKADIRNSTLCFRAGRLRSSSSVYTRIEWNGVAKKAFKEVANKETMFIKQNCRECRNYVECSLDGFPNIVMDITAKDDPKVLALWPSRILVVGPAYCSPSSERPIGYEL